MAEVPTLAELGYPDLNIDSWFGLVAPKGTPDAVIAKLNEEFAKASRSPELIALLGKQGIAAKTGAPSEFGDLITSSTEQFGKVIKAIGARAN
jgi:tripartite-type tricarboxylate transporter receptor subunit TctC